LTIFGCYRADNTDVLFYDFAVTKPKGQTMNEKLMNTKELAEYLGVARSTLIQYRKDGTGPVYIKLGHLVRYKKMDVDIWVEEKKTTILS
jgi:excisionase family DNA binding protein